MPAPGFRDRFATLRFPCASRTGFGRASRGRIFRFAENWKSRYRAILKFRFAKFVARFAPPGINYTECFALGFRDRFATLRFHALRARGTGRASRGRIFRFAENWKSRYRAISLNFRFVKIYGALRTAWHNYIPIASRSGSGTASRPCSFRALRTRVWTALSRGRISRFAENWKSRYRTIYKNVASRNFCRASCRLVQLYSECLALGFSSFAVLRFACASRADFGRALRGRIFRFAEIKSRFARYNLYPEYFALGFWLASLAVIRVPRGFARPRSAGPGSWFYLFLNDF